ncbi:PREDICTED: uncharacterized protein LOC105571206 [Vollenhovia emeryi]|uniref:uncharacterized protein LOC105571206 n=1 Tax=Vollenhovia emeryi TaxID=411798 RepID=UPI0005F38DD9|nr:PREDICTED: uncharacterized protein LOC105571206 [Vollenhovia emeryi]
MAPYVPTWPLYEECMFLADHIVARKTSSGYSTNALPKSQTATVVRPNFEADRASPVFARPSPSPSPPVFRLTPARPSPSPSPPAIRSILSPQTSESLSPSNVESDASNSQNSAGQSLASTEEGVSVSSDVSSASESIIRAIKTAKLKGKRTVPPPDNFNVKKKKEDDALAQAILNQTSVLSSMTAKLDKDISIATSDNVANLSNISPIMSAVSFALQSVPRERHLECMMEILKIITEKYAKQ